MKKQFIFIIVTCFWSVSFAQQTRVLFIGNSYTGVNDLPGMFYNLALSLGDTVYYESNSPGGFTFNMHTTNTTTLQKIALPGWDYVVLQAQSQEPSFSPSQVATNTYPFATKLDSLIHAANPCAKTMFYMTWGRKYGDASNCAFYPPVCTFTGMNDRLRASYLEMGADNFAQVSPVGVAWRKSREMDSTINLWSGDNSHPSVAGTYLTACVFYASIFKESPIGAPYLAGLTAPQASFLQGIADQTVFDSLNTWMLNQNPLNAAFNYMAIGNTIQFENTSYNATQFSWYFGDGDSSILSNPTHIFINGGSFTVQLMASNNCYSDTITLNINIPNSTSITSEFDPEMMIYPNPSNGLIQFNSVSGIGEIYKLYNSTGLLIKSGKIESLQLDFTNISKGLYYLEISNQIQKIIFQ
jgi:hypothetical protein